MAYENYTQVSWTPGTPITSDRLQQMSQNIQEVKDATDDKPKGIIKFKSITASGTYNTMANAPGGVGTLISLINEGTGNPDNRVTADANRYLRIAISFPGFAITSYGQEDALYELILIESDSSNSNSTIATWDLSSGPLLWVNTATSGSALLFANTQIVSNASPLLSGNKVSNNSTVITFSGALSNANSNLKTLTASNPYVLGAGTYTFVKTTGIGLTNYSYYLNINRKMGANSNNASTFYVANSAPTQLYVEDIGGTA